MDAVVAGAVVVEAALLGLLLVGYRRGNTPAVVNTAGAALLTLVPAALAAVLGIGAGAVTIPGLTLWIAVAGSLHGLGMLGRYESVWWWDHLTHTLSAMLVAALLYAWVLGVAPAFATTGAVLGTLGLGVLWEGGELIARAVADRFDIEPVLVHYGWRDTGLDLLFDAVGAILVVALDLRLFVPTVESVLRAAGVA